METFVVYQSAILFFKDLFAINTPMSVYHPHFILRSVRVAHLVEASLQTQSALTRFCFSAASFLLMMMHIETFHCSVQPL